MIRLTHIISNHLDIRNEDVSDKTELRDLTDDSLDFIELILLIEEEYDVEIMEDDLDKLITVKDLYNYITNDQCEKSTK